MVAPGTAAVVSYPWAEAAYRVHEGDGVDVAVMLHTAAAVPQAFTGRLPVVAPSPGLRAAYLAFSRYRVRTGHHVLSTPKSFSPVVAGHSMWRGH